MKLTDQIGRIQEVFGSHLPIHDWQQSQEETGFVYFCMGGTFAICLGKDLREINTIPICMAVALSVINAAQAALTRESVIQTLSNKYQDLKWFIDGQHLTFDLAMKEEIAIQEIDFYVSFFEEYRDSCQKENPGHELYLLPCLEFLADFESDVGPNVISV